MESDYRMSTDCRRQSACCASNLSIGYGEPDYVGLDPGPRSHRTRAHVMSQAGCTAERGASRSRNDRIDGVTCPPQGYCQCLTHFSSADDCDARLRSHARQNSRVTFALFRHSEDQRPCFIFVSMPKDLRASSRRTKSRQRETQRHARILSSLVVYGGPVFWVTTDQGEEPGCVRMRRDLIHHSASAVILAVDESGGLAPVLLEPQY